MRLNCDMGEGMAYDAQIMPLIDMANLACGGHAGSIALMRENVQRAKKHRVAIGAHPSYPDRAHFGRLSLEIAPALLKREIIEQVGRLDAVCREYDTELVYVKPHGALYNDMMRSEGIFDTVVEAIASYDSGLKLMILSTLENEKYRLLAQRYGITLLYELFADRNYSDEGWLQPRSEPDAVIHDVDQIVERIASYRKRGILHSVGGKPLKLGGDSLCVHGDNAESLAVIKALRAMLES